MSDDQRTGTATTATTESSGDPGTPGSDEPKAGYGGEVPADAGTGAGKREAPPAGGGQGAA